MYIISMTLLNLSSEEREFCSLVAKAGTVNHFSPKRLEVDKKIAQVSPLASREETFSHLIERITQVIRKMEEENRADYKKYQEPDRKLVEITFLFELFHLYMIAFDHHISDQLASDSSPCSVPFADKALADFAQRGFNQEEGLEWFAILFQLRRAYYFIGRQLIGTCPCMDKLRIDLWNNIFTFDQVFFKQHLLQRMEDFSTLILGDTGTGKGTAAAAIGRSGFIPFNSKTRTFTESFTRAFVSLNLSQFPEGLIESELFGHKKGAFTGAVEAHEGIFARCSAQGSIFLDEIGDISIPIQIKLLHVLQDRYFSPVGSHKRLRFSGRVIAATNKDIYELRRKKIFRNDFYYRLCSDVIVMPTLFQRIKEDDQELSALISHVTQRIVGTEQEELTQKIHSIINKKLGPHYTWPGNVRELEQAVRRIILKQDYEGDRSDVEHTPLSQLISDIQQETIDANCLLAQYCAILYEHHQTFQAVSTITGLDRRTVKKYVEQAKDQRRVPDNHNNNEQVS